MKLKSLLLVTLLLSSAYGDDRAVKSSDISSFVISADIKEQLKREIVKDLNMTFESVRDSLEISIQKEFKRSKNIYKAEVLSLQKEVKVLKEQVSLFKDMIVDTNYQRNVRDDRVKMLLKTVDEMDERLKLLENKKLAPIKNKSGEKI